MKKLFFNLLVFGSAIMMFGACNKQAENTEEVVPIKDSIVSGVSSAKEHIKIAYMDISRFTVEYKPAVRAMEDLRVEQAKIEREFEARQKSLEAEAAKFEEKVKNRAFLSETSAQSQYDDLQRKSQQIQQDYAKKVQEFTLKTQKLEQQYGDTLQNYLKEYNADGKYEMILDRAVILTAVEGYDITDEVIGNLNRRSEKQ